MRLDQATRVTKLLWLASLLLLSGCAGYQFGNRTLFRSDIRTIHIPVFESESYRRFLGQSLTEAVVKQVELDTPLVIANPAFADSVLRGRILQDRKRSRTIDRFGEPRVLQAEWYVEVDWVDRSGNPLMQRQKVRITDAQEFIPEAGQSMTTAQLELTRKIARQIVGQMESSW